VRAQTLNDNLKELKVIESKRNAIRKGFVYELLNTQDRGVRGRQRQVFLNAGSLGIFDKCLSTPLHYPALTLAPTCGANRAS
jgi:hypothetical protein